MLGLADFPADGGWDGQSLGTATQDAGDRQDEKLSAFPACAGLRRAFRLIYASPNSSTQYENGPAVVSNTVAVLGSAKQAQRYRGAYTKAGKCMRDYWATLFDANAAAKVVLAPLPKAVLRGGVTGIRLRTDSTQDGEPHVEYYDFLATGKGSSVASFTFSSEDAPFPQALETKLVSTVAKRLPA